MWPLLSGIAGSIGFPRRSRARDEAGRRRTHVIAEGAAGCAVAAALGGRAATGKVVAVVSGGNIDLSKFASLVGACDDPHSSIANRQ
jgi:threonine dehydratase